VHNDVPVAAEELIGPQQRLEIPAPEIYYVVVYAVCVIIVETGPLSPAGRIAGSAALAVMVPWYLLVGRRLLYADEAGWRVMSALRGPVYLIGLLPLFAVVQSQNLNAWFMSFAISPQCFSMTTERRAMGFVLAFNGVAGILVVAEHPASATAATALGLVVFSVGFSYVFSRYTVRVVEQNEANAVLIKELSTARHELAAVHHEAGVLAERHRLAGEIHDTLAQGFTSIVTLVQAAQAGLDPGATQARRHLDLALATARDNLAEARALVEALRPAGLESSSLGDALRRVTQTTGAEAGLLARTEVEGQVRPLPTGTEVVLLRVCQEALANIRKHAGAQAVLVRLHYGGDVVQLEITDDGVGFDTAAVNSGYGLRGMSDRLQQAGGTVRVRSAPGAGTAVRAEVRDDQGAGLIAGLTL
jgi:signal transduction histidine kinase